jgi:hypothetical protein
MTSKHLAVTQNRKASLAADRGESVTTYHPSNSSTGSSIKSGKSFVESPMPVHSKHRAAASKTYHANTVEATYVRPSATKMTKAEHQLNNQEDMSEKSHKL